MVSDPVLGVEVYDDYIVGDEWNAFELGETKTVREDLASGLRGQGQRELLDLGRRRGGG